MIIYTCITNDYDNVNQLHNRRFDHTASATYVLFTNSDSQVIQWNISPLKYQHSHNAKTARWHKTHPHILFPDSTTLWIDGNQIPFGSIDKILQTTPFGVFKHPKRDCIYDEMLACHHQNKDVLRIILPQIEKYRAAGYPEHNGLAETCCLLRENTKENARFNEAWWSEIKEHSHRDQLSFDYVIWKLGMAYNIIPGCRIESEFCNVISEH